MLKVDTCAKGPRGREVRAPTAHAARRSGLINGKAERNVLVAAAFVGVAFAVAVYFALSQQALARQVTELRRLVDSYERQLGELGRHERAPVVRSASPPAPAAAAPAAAAAPSPRAAEVVEEPEQEEGEALVDLRIQLVREAKFGARARLVLMNRGSGVAYGIFVQVPAGTGLMVFAGNPVPRLPPGEDAEIPVVISDPEAQHRPVLVRWEQPKGELREASMDLDLGYGKLV